MKKSAIIDGKIIEYYLIDPTGNITILVESFVCTDDQPYIASRLMEIEKTCEQVGFVTRYAAKQKIKGEIVDITLRMSAGEFCGNATMSTAALYCMYNSLNENESMSVIVDSSGVEKPCVVDITCMERGVSYKGSVEMPSPLSIDNEKFEYKESQYEFPVVDFGGIAHAIMMPGPQSDIIRENAEAVVKKWCEDKKYDGLGLIFVDITYNYVNKAYTAPVLTDSNNISLVVNPLVYVPACNTCFWESSCGSGTTALGAYLSRDYFASSASADTYTISAKEPGGALTITAKRSGKYILGGRVVI